MSLLDCICCSRHGYRTAASWGSIPCHVTYSEFVFRALTIAKKVSNYLKEEQYPFSPIAVCGLLYPDILAGILGVLSSPLFIFQCDKRDKGVFGGVAFLPLSTGVQADDFSKLQENEVETILVELSTFQVIYTTVSVIYQYYYYYYLFICYCISYLVKLDLDAAVVCSLYIIMLL